MLIEWGRVSAYRVPTDEPEESDGTATWDSTTVLVVELSAGGETGLGYSYTSKAAASVAQEFVEKDLLGQNHHSIPALNLAMGIRARNLGKPGLVSTAISAADTCLWDLQARLLNCSLTDLLGRSRDRIPAYGSGGFTSYSEPQLIKQLTNWAESGLREVKMKVGRHPDQDLSRVKAVSRALGGSASLFVDANGAYSRKQGLEKASHYADLNVTWFEEPVSSDDRTGLSLLVNRAPASLRIAAGEYCYVLDDARMLIESQAVDVLQADATRCGGVSGFMKIAAACEMHHFPLSAHTAPSLHAALCCSAIPAINVEYFHDHVRVESMLFEDSQKQRGGYLIAEEERRGLGLILQRRKCEEFLVFNWDSR